MMSSPKHVKSNSKAKAAAEIVKKIFKKAYRDNKDPWLALIDQRNVPKFQGWIINPIQHLKSHKRIWMKRLKINMVF